MFNKLLFPILAIAGLSLHAGEPFVVFEGPSSAAPRQPQACVSGDGIIHLTFGIGDQVYYCKVQDSNAPNPQVAFSVPNLSLGMRRGPRIAMIGKTIVITAIGGQQGKGRDGDLLAYRSEDEGKSWSSPIRVNDVESSAREGLHAMTATDDGILWCVWLDLREKGTQLFAANSIDNGKSWNRNMLVYRSPDGSVCECCHPSVTASGQQIHVLFRNSLAGNRDMYVVSSYDRGVSFGQAKQLGLQPWSLNACPMDGGMLVMSNERNVLSVWRRGGTIYSSSSMKSSATLVGAGEQPWVASNSTGTYVAWLSRRDGDLLVDKIDSSNPQKIAENARDPVIVSSESPMPKVHVFWEQSIGNRTAIMGRLIE